jgi:predicted RNA-binding Zn-ribbon protein involved in translation (DUF1610 family)
MTTPVIALICPNCGAVIRRSKSDDLTVINGWASSSKVHFCTGCGQTIKRRRLMKVEQTGAWPGTWEVSV